MLRRRMRLLRDSKEPKSLTVGRDTERVRTWRAFLSLFNLLAVALVLIYLFHSRDGRFWRGRRGRKALLAAQSGLADRHGSLYGTEYAMLGRKGSECRQKWILRGIPCNPNSYVNGEIDVLWSWQNKSDVTRWQPLLDASKADSLLATTCTIDNIRPASFDMLRFSFRSAQKHLSSGFGTLNLMTPDYEVNFRPETQISFLRNSLRFLHKFQISHRKALTTTSNASTTANGPGNMSHSIISEHINDQENASSSTLTRLPGTTPSERSKFLDEIGRQRLGQVPHWLKEHRKFQSISIKHHWDIACGTSKLKTKNNPQATQRDWDKLASFACKEKRLPTFNPTVSESIAHEAHGLTDVVVHVKDHQFFGKDVSSSDFYTPLYGPVFRLAYTGVTQSLEHEPDGSDLPGMAAANVLLSRRFGHRDRPKLLNIPRVAVQTLSDEARNIWSRELSKATLNRCPSRGDINMPYLVAHYAMERHREALLWSFFVARSDRNADDTYSGREIKQILEDMGLTRASLPKSGQALAVYYPKRDTLKNDRYQKNIVESRFPAPLLKDVTFTSQDGFYGTPLYKKHRNTRTRWPDYDDSTWEADEKKLMACRLSDVCFDPFRLQEGDKDPKASDVFKYFTFQRWGCGDCLIILLLSKSGPKGLKAFLPSEDSRFPEARSLYLSGHLPHLPYNAAFEKQDFSLLGVARETNLGFANRLNFVTSLLVRYQYALAQGNEQTDTILQDRYEPKNQLVELELSRPFLFSIRDNTTTKAPLGDLASHAWLRNRFPESIPFEK